MELHCTIILKEKKKKSEKSVNYCYRMQSFHETDPDEIKGRMQFHLKNNAMIGYWYTVEPYFLLEKSFSAVPLNLTRFTELIKNTLEN